jgi:hypothetical protein
MNITLNLHIDTVNAALTGMGELPYKAVAPHINEIQRQAIPQVEAAQAVEVVKQKKADAQMELPFEDPNQ